MQDSIILDIASHPDGDNLIVTTQHCPEPDACFSIKLNLTDQHGRLCDPRRLIESEASFRQGCKAA